MLLSSTMAGVSDVIVRSLRESDSTQALAGHAELASEDFQFLLDLRDDEPWAAYVARTLQWPAGLGLSDGQVPSSFLVGDVDGVVVGRISIRHRLNDWLAELGGHIGYAVRPAYRRRGYATSLLRGGLSLSRGLGLDRVLLTCDDSNVGSATVIENCGGVFERLARVDEGVAPRRRYWITL